MKKDIISDTALEEAVRSFNIIMVILDKNPDHPMNGNDIYIIVRQRGHKVSSWVNIELKSNKAGIEINADSRKISYDRLSDITFDIDSLKIQNAVSFDTASIAGLRIKSKLELTDCMYSNNDYALNDNDILILKEKYPDIKIIVDDPARHLES